MEIDVTTVVIVTALQLVQNAQLYWLTRGQRRLSRTLIPPPLSPPPPAAREEHRPWHDALLPPAKYCQNCGDLHPSEELLHGLCATCLGGSTTVPPPFDGQHPGTRRRR